MVEPDIGTSADPGHQHATPCCGFENLVETGVAPVLDQAQGVAATDVNDVECVRPMRCGHRIAAHRQVRELVCQGRAALVKPTNLDGVILTGGANEADAWPRAT